MRLHMLLLAVILLITVPLAAPSSSAATTTAVLDAQPGPPLDVAPQLLGDLAPGADMSTALNPGDLIALSPVLAIFKAFTPATGYELWRTDGTLGGTFALGDLWPGPVSGDPTTIQALNGVGWFWVYAGPDAPRTLWRTDGTVAGTYRFAAADGAVTALIEQPLAALGSDVFFAAEDADGVELWRTDGTVAETAQVADLNSGAADSYPQSLTALDGWLYFSTWSASGMAIWRTQGTAVTTSVLATGQRFEAAVESGEALYARGYDPTGVCNLVRISGSAVTLLSTLCPDQLIASDGWVAVVERTTGNVYVAADTPASVQLRHASNSLRVQVVDDPWTDNQVVIGDGNQVLRVDLASGQSTALINAPIGRITALSATPNMLLVAYMQDYPNPGPRLWSFDGQQEQTTTPARSLDGVLIVNQHGVARQDGAHGSGHLLLLDTLTDPGQIIPTTAYAVPHSSLSEYSYLDVIDSRRAVIFGDGLYALTAGAGLNQINPATTGMCAQMPFMAALNDQLLYATSYPFFVSDGTAAGTSLLGLDGIARFRMGNRVYVADYFYASNGIWSTDGTPAGTHRVTASSAHSSWWGQIDSNVLVSIGSTLFALNSATDALTPLVSSPIETGFATPDHSHFVLANPLTTTTRLWTTDGTSAGTQVLATLPFTGAVELLGERDGGLDLAVHSPVSQRIELWHSNGTPGGTYRAATITNVSGDVPLEYSAVNGGYFLNVQSRVWWFDPAHQTTALVYTAPGARPLELLTELSAVRRVLIRWTELPAGPKHVLIVSPASVQELPLPAPLMSIMAHDSERAVLSLSIPGTHQQQLWTTNGTLAGTQRLTAATMVDPLQQLNELAQGASFYFLGQDHLGAELWHTDGTAAGTRRVVDLAPGPQSSTIFEYTSSVYGVVCRPVQASVSPAASRPAAPSAAPLMFVASDGRSGLEVWSSDGTATGTHRLTDLNPGPADSINQITRWHDQTYLLLADDGIHGTEPFSLELFRQPMLFLPLLQR